MITLNRKFKKEAVETTNGISNDPSKRISVRDKLLVKEVQEMNENLPVTCDVSFEDPNLLSEFILTVKPDEGYWQGGIFKFSVFVTDDYNMAPPKVKCLTKLWHPNISEDGDICLSLLRQTSIDEHGWAPTRRLKDVVWGLNSLFTPPKVKCLTKLWHPNISEDGDICLSLLRQTSIDEHGWAPTRRLKDVAWGFNSLFTPPKVKFLTKLWHPNISEDGDICLSLLRQTSIDEHGWAPTRRLKDVAWGFNSLFTDLLNYDDPLNIEAAEQYKQDKLEFQLKVQEYISISGKR